MGRRRQAAATSASSAGVPSVARRGLIAAGVGMSGLVLVNTEKVLRTRRNARAMRQPLDHAALVGEGLGEPTQLVVLGDSAADGFGLESPKDAFPWHAAQHLSLATGRRVQVRSLAKDGSRIADVLHAQVPLLGSSRPDVVFVICGANDVFGRRRTGDVTADTRALISALVEASDGATLALLSGPDFGRAPGFHQPLRSVFGWRSRRVSAAMARVAAEEGVAFVDLVGQTRPEHFGPDGVHPGRDASIACAKAAVDAAMASAELLSKA